MSLWAFLTSQQSKDSYLLEEEKADDIYDRMMSLAYPKGASVILNIMDNLPTSIEQ